MDTAKRVVVEEEYLYGMIPGSKRGRAFVAFPIDLDLNVCPSAYMA